MSSTPKKRAPRVQRPSVTSYPLPAPETVKDIQSRLFSDRFVDNHLSALLGRASVAISAEFHEDVRRYKMPVAHWRVLATLYDTQNLSLSALADFTLINQATLTRLVQRLEAMGLLRKSPDTKDRRVTRVSLTKRGQERVDELIGLADERQQRILEGIDAEALKNSLQYLIALCVAKRGG